MNESTEDKREQKNALDWVFFLRDRAFLLNMASLSRRTSARERESKGERKREIEKKRGGGARVNGRERAHTVSELQSTFESQAHL